MARCERGRPGRWDALRIRRRARSGAVIGEEAERRTSVTGAQGSARRLSIALGGRAAMECRLLRYYTPAGVRSIFALAGIYLMALLLAGSSPLGAGDATHGGAVLHSALPHVHCRAFQDATAARASNDRIRLGTTLDTSAGGATEPPTVGLTPPLPRPSAASVEAVFHSGLESREYPWRDRLLDPPPDPPPTTRPLLLTASVFNSRFE
jgi:hypothetical protein